jgi:hypothetical protein
MAFKLKSFAGIVAKDLPIYAFAMLSPSSNWLAVRNRTERLDPAPDGNGYRCDWQWTSDLHAPKILPFLGSLLMKRALADHPIRNLSQPETSSNKFEVSFIIGHRGMARLPHLLATLESIAGQQNVPFECIVVEQEAESQLTGYLPSWVRHIHTPPPSPNMPYSRSWAFNVGVKLARSNALVLHDNDMLVPADYAAQILARINQGHEAINLKRFIFYLKEGHTQAVFAGHASLFEDAPDSIVQNLEAGGSIAITRAAYERIGGMDESFIGWGGEDNEFWERAQTCKVWPYGCLPLVHLWHSSQSDKPNANAFGKKHYHELSQIPVEVRISTLRNSPQGNRSGPFSFQVKERRNA